LIVGAFQVTLPVIERNTAEALQSAIFHVLPSATASKTYVYDDARGFAPAEADDPAAPRVHVGYDGDKLVGVAIEAEGMGYQDVIRLIYGYSVSEQAIIGVRVLESKETPGLGDKIETDPDFLANFERLDASLGDDRSSLAHPIVPVPHGEKEHPWEVDGITGATISSEAIASILNRSAARWAPRLQTSNAPWTGAASP
jgi:electron transport complex protein RnfG